MRAIMKQLQIVLIGAVLIGVVGCAGGPGVKMTPFTPDEVGIIVGAATDTYLMKQNVRPDVALKAVAYITVVQATVETGEVDLSALRTQVVDKVPPQWQPLAAATWIIILKHINLQQLIADGQHAEARAYIDAALSGALTALRSRAGG